MSLKLKEYFRLPNTQKNKLKEGGRRIKKKNVNVKPFFSIITVVLNNEKFIEQTIKSVLNQKYKNFEYIIIDGGSTDSTIEIIKKYEKKIDYWVSGKDKGLYDAFNKGMSVAKGEFIGIINSDDLYVLFLNMY